MPDMPAIREIAAKHGIFLIEDAAEKMGVDVMRWTFARHNPASNLNFGYGPGDEVRRQFRENPGSYSGHRVALDRCYTREHLLDRRIVIRVSVPEHTELRSEHHQLV